MIKITQTTKGSPDGLRVYTYAADGIYSSATTPPTSDKLENTFVNIIGCAEWYDEPETKVVEPSPEKKVVKPAAEKKTTKRRAKK